MQFIYSGNNPNFLEQSFFDASGTLSVELTSISPTQAVMTHTLFTQANVNVVLRGLGFIADEEGSFLSGVITSMEFNGLDIEQATISDINWSASAFQDALIDIDDRSDFTGLATLFNSSAEISVDASNAISGFNQAATWAGFLPLITRPITFVGTRFDDDVQGGSGNDFISTGASNTDGDFIIGSLGNDTIDFDVPEGTDGPGFFLDYDLIGTPVTFDINGVMNTGTVSTTGFTDTLLNVEDALGQYLGLEGSSGADTYSLRLGDNQTVSIIGGPGADVYNVDPGTGLPIFDFLFSDVTEGLDLNFATGVIANDGFGSAETINFVTTPDLTVVFATDLGDVVIDGPGAQLVRLYQGDDFFASDLVGQDSIDGGDGRDIVSFDAVAQGDMTLTFNGSVTTVSDRTDTAGSAALLRIETIETAGDVAFELDKHDGIGLISAADLTTLTELYIAYFNRAADALGLSFWATAFQKNGFSFEAIADLFFDQPETVALYSGTSNDNFVTAVYNNVLGRDPDADGFNFWTGQLNAGTVTASSFILDLLAGARAATGSPADVAYIEDKTDIGLYFAVVQGQNNLAAANSVMDAFNGSAESLSAARDLSDASLIVAETGSTDLLMPVVGVIDNPFADIA
ncbi:MAG: DUF4214 domain-containing protein [Rhodobacteraceae bacterium]|nr:DUF4214 domain-containing protein [Paracoccaceae bacterium]